MFDVVNRYGECEPKQEKALEVLGIPLPEPDKKPSRVNNRKITFDKICRELLLGICQEHGLVVETEAIYGGRESREKMITSLRRSGKRSPSWKSGMQN